MNLTGKQVLMIIAAVLSALVGASAQLTDIFGPTITKAIISVISLANTILTSITAALSGQANLVRDVAAMPGVERVSVNTSANMALAQVAVDPQQPKVGATDPGTRIVLQDTAKGETA